MRSCSAGKRTWRPRYFFDHRTHRCRLYWADGCEEEYTGRSRNHFDDMAQCQWRCEGGFKETPEERSCLDAFDEGYKGDCLGEKED